MSADRLREAARVLRERAEAARDALGTAPWTFTGIGWNNVQGTTYDGGNGGTELASTITEETAAYIATMHPGVGLALADWLDGAASNAELMQAVIDTGRADNPHASLARPKADDVADLLLGSASS